jgi:hypothetical protein
MYSIGVAISFIERFDEVGEVIKVGKPQPLNFSKKYLHFQESYERNRLFL